VNPSVQAGSVREFIALAKGKPDGLTYASAGTGSIARLVGEWVKSEAKIQVLEVPYKGVNAELPDLVGGQVLTAYIVPQVVLANVRSGKLRPLAVAAQSRLARRSKTPAPTWPPTRRRSSRHLSRARARSGAK